jgi:hypothetical protein
MPAWSARFLTATPGHAPGTCVAHGAIGRSSHCWFAAAGVSHDIDNEPVGILLEEGDFVPQLGEGCRRRREAGDPQVADANTVGLVGAGEVEVTRHTSESLHEIGRQTGGKHRRSLSEAEYVAAGAASPVPDTVSPLRSGSSSGSSSGRRKFVSSSHGP